MMRNEIESSIVQLGILTRIARFLADSGLIVYRCRYDFLAFGAWMIEAGTPHLRLQITRDGQERTLRCATAHMRNASAVPEWEERQVVPFDLASDADLDDSVKILIREFISATNRPASAAD